MKRLFGEGLGEVNHGSSSAAADVEDIDSRPSRVSKPGASGRMCSSKTGDDCLRAFLGHHFMEARVSGVRGTPGRG